MSDLAKEEQDRVRTAMRFLRAQFETWNTLAHALRCSPVTLRNVMAGRCNVTASHALRVARLANVSVDDVLDGTYPPANVCPHCGQPLLGIARESGAARGTDA